MGRAAVDLPDPLAAAPAGTTANTDDLLAQMAGEEIERLLAEADDAPPAPPQSAAPAAPPAVQPSAKTPVAPPAVSSLLEPPVANAPKRAPTSPVAVAAPAPSPATDADLDALFTQLGSTSPASHATTAPAPPANPPAPADAEPSAAEALAQEMLEDAATSGPATALTAHVSAAAPQPPPPAREASDSVPIYLKLLGLISAPLDAYPDHVRDVIGKVAILTTVNAISVLAYVLIFRSR